jgi:hypothetical protein
MHISPFKGPINVPSNFASKQKCKRKVLIFKIFIGFATIAFMLANSFGNLAGVSEEPKCIEDKMIDLTEPIYKYFMNHEEGKNNLMILTFLSLDFIVFCSAIIYFIKGNNSRPILTLFLFFSFRLFCNYIFVLRDNSDKQWENPGFPSFTVTFNNEPDNGFFSAIVGIYVICFVELNHYRYRISSFVTLLSMFSYIILSISLRAEYFMSIFCGLFSAHYFSIIAGKYHHIVDNYIPLFRKENRNYGRKNSDNNFTKNQIDINIKMSNLDKEGRVINIGSPDKIYTSL